jgi:SAM-dependent methyltransferase
MNLPKHLGGHCRRTHLDVAVLHYFTERHGVTSLLDVGCGPGGMVEEALRLGLRAVGIDGDFTLPPHDWRVVHDFTTGPINLGPFDLGWSVEFLEHVEERFIPNYMAAFAGCRRVVCTHAPPGKPGFHHVNTRDDDYWIETFHRHGFAFAPEDTQAVRQISNMERDFMRKTGLVFEHCL